MLARRLRGLSGHAEPNSHVHQRIPVARTDCRTACASGRQLQRPCQRLGNTRYLCLRDRAAGARTQDSQRTPDRHRNRRVGALGRRETGKFCLAVDRHERTGQTFLSNQGRGHCPCPGPPGARHTGGPSPTPVSVNPDSAILTSSTRQAVRAQTPMRHKVLQIKDLRKSSPQA